MAQRGFIAAIVALAVAACTVTGVAFASSVHPESAKPTASSSARARSIEPIGIYKCKKPVTPTDEAVQVPGSRLIAHVLTFRWNGNVAFERIPPAGWKPATANNAELAFFHVGPRPSHGKALAAWTSEWVTNFTAIEPARPFADKMAGSTR